MIKGTVSCSRGSYWLASFLIATNSYKYSDTSRNSLVENIRRKMTGFSQTKDHKQRSSDPHQKGQWCHFCVIAGLSSCTDFLLLYCLYIQAHHLQVCRNYIAWAAIQLYTFHQGRKTDRWLGKPLQFTSNPPPKKQPIVRLHVHACISGCCR